jgi:hypothetical protein
VGEFEVAIRGLRKPSRERKRIVVSAPAYLVMKIHWSHEASQEMDRLLAQKQIISASKKSGQLTCCETGQFYLLLTNPLGPVASNCK